MYKVIWMCCALLFLTACKKSVQQTVEDQVMEAIIKGRWKVTSFTKANTNISNDFAPYEFQFLNNSKVEAYKNGVLQKAGTWEGHADTKTIISNFSDATFPVGLLNGSWKISDNTWTIVEANQTVNGEYLTLRLDKQ